MTRAPLPPQEMRETIECMSAAAGIYISVPFCKAKCTYCNFASDAFGIQRMDVYVGRLCNELRSIRARAESMGACLPPQADTIYLGGGTPSLLELRHIRQLFAAIRAEFDVLYASEITLECAPGQLSDAALEEFQRSGVNRISLGVQSFVDAETRAVGRSHTRQVCLSEIERLRGAGIANLNVDLIAGLPRQTSSSWRESVQIATRTGVPHISIYMLEVDEDSRLGRELLDDGSRYGAAHVPDEDTVASFYSSACEWLSSAGIDQYEISNFARPGTHSRHNLKYWQRHPYVGFGLDAHSMLRGGHEVLRFANTADLDTYLQPASPLHILAHAPESARLGIEKQFEEALFLGLRMNQGVSLAHLRAEFGVLAESLQHGAQDAILAGLLVRHQDRLQLTQAGRVASNEVFSRLLLEPSLCRN